MGACSPRKFFWIWCCEMASEAILGAHNITTNLCFNPGLVANRILIHFTSGHMEISVHQYIQVPRELAAWKSDPRKLFCLVFIVFQAMTAENVWPPCWKSARSQVSAALFYIRTVCLCRHGSVQTIRGLLACKQRVGDAISVKILLRQLPGLPYLLCRPCSKVHWLYWSRSEYWRWML